MNQQPEADRNLSLGSNHIEIKVEKKKKTPSER